MPENTPRIEITTPRLFNTKALIVVCAYGAALMIPTLVAALVLVGLHPLSWRTWLMPLLVLAVSSFFLPLGLGNPYVLRLVRRIEPEAGNKPNSFVVQLTLCPRLRAGLEAQLEDADDLGCLTIGASAVVFRGDSVRLTVPFGQIKEVRRRNIGWRGLFVYGARVVVKAEGFPEIEYFEFGERSSSWLPQSRRIGRQLYDSLVAAISRPPAPG